MQVLLSSPEITCEHCIETIRGVADGASGVAFVSGNPDARTFVLDVASGAALDALSAALAEAGYPLGAVDAPAAESHGVLTPDWRPEAYRIEKTDVGANVNYDCYCGCDAGFALDRSQSDQATESCCCGNHMLVGAGAAERILGKLDDASKYRVDVQQTTMPWGQPMDVALAIPLGE
jgi:copper chaperone CopZ